MRKRRNKKPRLRRVFNFYGEGGQKEFVKGELFKRKPVYSRRERREKYCRHTRGSAEVSDRTSNAEEKGFEKKNGEGGIRTLGGLLHASFQD